MVSVSAAFLNATEAAQRLGISRQTLRTLGAEHPVYAPVVAGVPGARSGQRMIRYSRAQVEIIEALWVGAFGLDEAALRMDALRNSRRSAGLPGRTASVRSK